MTIASNMWATSDESFFWCAVVVAASAARSQIRKTRFFRAIERGAAGDDGSKCEGRT